ncbi:adenylyltransferase/cytidyltransferase family protein [Candidatus Gracilibacteria bacterium]|nr:adenylyltransferase/cytidyltransferase family protein [Candidatus Gracilibacteria bacterium]
MQKSHTHRHIMTFGTFDLFHPGHVYYLTEAQKLGEKMTIVIARDHRVIEKKGRQPIHDENRRQKNVAGVFSGAQVILGDESDIFQPIREKNPDLLVFGYDQKVPLEAIQAQFPDIGIARIDGFETDKWKSSLLRKNYED